MIQSDIIHIPGFPSVFSGNIIIVRRVLGSVFISGNLLLPFQQIGLPFHPLCAGAPHADIGFQVLDFLIDGSNLLILPFGHRRCSFLLQVHHSGLFVFVRILACRLLQHPQFFAGQPLQRLLIPQQQGPVELPHNIITVGGHHVLEEMVCDRNPEFSSLPASFVLRLHFLHGKVPQLLIQHIR
ncbi:MAG: hypothetical protein ACI3XG_02955 [Faecousia sp.]